MEPYHIINGLPLPKFVQEECLKEMRDLQLYPDDVWVVSYPKCGTTWTQQMVKLIRSRGVTDGVKITMAVPWLEARAGIPGFKLEDLSRPRAFKSHFPYQLFPCGPPCKTPCKFIYVARNPKDVAVSFFFHTRQGHYPDISWESFWTKYVGGELEFGDFFDHVLSWWPHRMEGNVLFLKYEDMKKAPQLAVSQIAAFMGAELSSDEIAKIADLSSFDSMKQDNTTNMSWMSVFDDTSGKPSFMRKGIVGDWTNFLSPQQSAQIDAICAEKLKVVGLEFQYE